MWRGGGRVLRTSAPKRRMRRDLERKGKGQADHYQGTGDSAQSPTGPPQGLGELLSPPVVIVLVTASLLWQPLSFQGSDCHFKGKNCQLLAWGSAQEIVICSNSNNR